MLKDFIRDPVGYTLLQGTEIETWLDDYAGYLTARGHAARTVKCYGLAVGHFSRWLLIRHVPLNSVNKETTETFIDRHLPHCQCPSPGPLWISTVRAAMRHFVVSLRKCGHILPSEPKTCAIDQSVEEFDLYLSKTCGLGEQTRIYRRRYVKEFLNSFFGKNEAVDIGKLDCADIIQVFTKRVKAVSSGTAQVIASSLRSYLRFQQMRGVCSPSLVAAVPSVPQWRLANLPKILTKEQFSKLFSAFDVQSATGLRDYAMTRCIADLGLRANEVAQLRLEDIDWRHGILQVPAGKIRRADKLPLPEAVGQAIADYLQHGRPSTVSRSVFVRHAVPIGHSIHSRVVHHAVRYASTRANLSGCSATPNVLRHTMATNMLRAGVSLKEIADFLRHRSLDTTAIYAKHDLPHLIDVALPWPGGTP